MRLYLFCVFLNKIYKNTVNDRQHHIADFEQVYINYYSRMKRFAQEYVIREDMLLGYTGSITTSYRNGRLTITPPVLTIDDYPSQHAWVYKISNFKE